MNKANIEKAIAIMRRAEQHDSLYMPDWQCATNNEEPTLARDEQALHACGNRACFGGHVAVSPEFRADGGSCTFQGAPAFDEHIGSDAIRDWLGIDEDTARNLVLGNATGPHPGYPGDHSVYYGKIFSDVTPADVIAKLEQLLEQTK